MAIAKQGPEDRFVSPAFVPDFFERFFDSYIEEPTSGCWLWIASQTSAGYGNLNAGTSRYLYAHRAAFEAHNGRGSSYRKVVRHRCDLPCCINPDHLKAGTQKQNVADMHARNRAVVRRGSEAGMAKLTEEIVLSARDMARDGMKLTHIAKHFGVNGGTLSFAIRGVWWAHLPGAVPGKKRKGKSND